MNAKFSFLMKQQVHLDKETEVSIVNTIKNLDKNLTILMITHREKCLEICDYTLKIEKKRIMINFIFLHLIILYIKIF